MSGQEQVAQLRRSVVQACRVFGIGEDSFIFGRSGFDMPDHGIKVSLIVSEGTRVWSAAETFVVSGPTRSEDRQYSTVFLEEPLGRELSFAKKFAMKMAEARIDAAIDASAG